MKIKIELIIIVIFIILSCQNPADNSIYEYKENSDNYNYLWDYDYVSNKGFSWGFYDTKKFYGIWESETERFIFENKTFKYWNNKNNIEPKITGEFGIMNITDLYCCLVNGNSYEIVIFTPFVFENNKLYLGINKYRLFNKVNYNETI